MAKLIAAQRQQQIVALLNENGSYKIGELAAHFNVSNETIRRDLNRLSDEGLIQKRYGGAITNYEFHSRDVQEKENVNTETKLKICQKALTLIPKDAVIYLDTGSTVAKLAGLITDPTVTIITASLSAAHNLLESPCTVYITGGQLNRKNLSIEGYQTTNFLENLKVEIAFLGSTGFDQHNGPTTIDSLDAQAKQIILRNAKKAIVLADSSKSKVTALNQYADWSEIDALITDDGIVPEALKKIEEDTSVIVV